MKKKITALILILLIIGTAAFFMTRKKENPNELTLYGNIEIRQVDLSFQVSGIIEKMLKEEGDSVKKGELLAILDSKDYKSNLEKAESEVNKTLALKMMQFPNLTVMLRWLKIIQFQNRNMIP